MFSQALVRAGFIHNIADIFLLKDHRDALINLGIIGKEKNTDKLLKEIEKSKENAPDRLLTALGIRNVGKRTASDIMKQFKDIRLLPSISKEEFLSVPDVGGTIADCIYSVFI